MNHDKDKKKLTIDTSEFDRDESVGNAALKAKEEGTEETTALDEDESVGGSEIKRKNKSDKD